MVTFFGTIIGLFSGYTPPVTRITCPAVAIPQAALIVLFAVAGDLPLLLSLPS